MVVWDTVTAFCLVSYKYLHTVPTLRTKPLPIHHFQYIQTPPSLHPNRENTTHTLSELQPATMSYLRYQSARTNERDPYDSDSYYPRPLVRRNSKRQRVSIYDDDECDDYPYTLSHKPSKPSRALTIRQPSQIEKYNIWSRPKHSSVEHHRHHSSDHEDDDDHTVRYKYTTTRYAQPDDDESDREREFRLKVKATFGRPRSSHSSSQKMAAWPGEAFKRREKFVDENWESRERERRGEWWDEPEPQLKERTVTYRRIKRTRTDEWKPLSGWRRS